MRNVAKFYVRVVSSDKMGGVISDFIFLLLKFVLSFLLSLTSHR